MAIFFLLQASSPREILKAFHATLTSPLISSTYLSHAITKRERGGKVDTVDDECWLPPRPFVT